MHVLTHPLPQDIGITGSVGAPYPVDRRRRPRVRLGQLGIDRFTRAEMLDDVLDHALHGTRTRQIVTANAQFYVLAEKDTRFRGCLERAEYSCADGMPVVWACNRFAGVQVPRIAGVDFIEDVCRKGAAEGLRLFLLGGIPGAAKAAAAILSARCPGVEIAGVSCPPFHFEEQAETLQPVLDAIAAAKPHILLVALGAPKQEFFIDQHVRPLGVPIAVGIGGSFEIISGALTRAPQWMQKAGLEWLFRLHQEPRRLWKRYLVGNVEFVLRLARWRLTSSPIAGTTTTGAARS
jgi:N-acetylglucosaminyldiphosphoundecaprenol N-acetyl-beta-D-mannosaminyltransferase